MKILVMARPISYNKYITFYLSKVAFEHLHYKLNLVNPEFEFDMDVFYGILNDLSSIKYFNSYTQHNAFIPMSSVWLKNTYGNHYNLYIQYLVQQSIISNSPYNANQCSYYSLVTNKPIIDMLDKEFNGTPYCFEIYDSELIQKIEFQCDARVRNVVKSLEVVSVKISTKNSVGKKIKNKHNKALDVIKHSEEQIKKMNKHFKETVGINYDEAIEYTLNKYAMDVAAAFDDEEKLQSAYLKAAYRIRTTIEIKEEKFRFKRNSTNKRLDTNLTNLSKDLRPFLIGYDNMSNLDLCNSQPVLFNKMLNEELPNANESLALEIQNYKQNTLGGNWYEALMDMYNVDRDKAKEIWMKIAYSKNRSYQKEKKIFAQQYPKIYDLIKTIKRKNHSQFAIQLQITESKIFIDEIAKELVSRNIIPYTLHDGLLVPKEKEQETYDVMAKILKAHLGKVPVISINNDKFYPSN